MPRSAIVRRLLAPGGAPVVAILAPAGYGKTTLLAQWVAQHPGPVAWLSVDPSCNDPAVLLSYLAVILDRVLAIPPATFDALSSAHRPQRAEVVAALATALAGARQPVLLVLDDVHCLSDPEGAAAIRTLIEHLPPGCRLAIAGRREPPLGLPRLRGEGRVLDIGIRDLRLTADEAEALLGAAGVHPPERELSELVQRTEGWAMGLYLAALARRPGVVPPLRAQTYSGKDRLFADYIRSEVLDPLPESRLRFLTRTAILVELCGPLVDAVLERSGSAGELEEIEAANLLLMPLDRERHWWRYHHLFQSLLCHELERTEPEAIPGLALRASRWCEANGLFDQAVYYGQLAADVARVSELTARGARRAVAAGRMAAVQHWVTWLADRGCTDPGVAVLGAWLATMTGRPAEAERWLAVAAAAPPDTMQPDGSPLEAWVLTLRAAMTTSPGDARAAAARALELLAPTADWRTSALASLGFAEWLDGEEQLADGHLRDAVEIGRASDAQNGAALALAVRAMAAIRRRRWSQADVLLREATAQVEASHLEGYPTTALSHALRARAAAHAGDIPVARRQITEARGLLPGLSRAFGLLAVQARLELVRACAAVGDVPAAAEVFDDVRRLLPDGTDPGSLWADAREVADLVAGASALPADLPRLTPAELRLLPSLATQRSLPEIARQQSLSPHTVKAQVTAIYRKLAASSRTEAVDRARALGLLPGPSSLVPRQYSPSRGRSPRVAADHKSAATLSTGKRAAGPLQ